MPRRMIQRAFLRWLEEKRSRFAIEIKLGRRTDTDLEFTFAGTLSALSGVLTTWEISVYVIHKDESWDCLLDVSARPKRVPNGYVCNLCPPESRPVFLSRPALWADHLFEKFLDWVNESLAKAKWLALYGSPDYGTWARLLPEDMDEKPKVPPILMPCRVDTS